MQKSSNVIVLGPPGSGKGTQVSRFASKRHLPHISTGDILRQIKADAANPRSAEIARFIDNGQLVPKEIMLELVADRLKSEDCANGFVLDGFPRTLEQAEFLDSITDIGLAILIEVADESIVKRMAGRRVCKNGHTYHIDFNPPKQADVCDQCGEPLFLRDDDQPATVQGRLDIYHRETDAIISRYEGKGILIRIDGEKPIDEVEKEIDEKTGFLAE